MSLPDQANRKYLGIGKDQRYYESQQIRLLDAQLDEPGLGGRGYVGEDR